MEIEELKLVRVTHKNKTIEFSVPLDFKVTEEYVLKKFNSKKITACEEWLKKKGFIYEEYFGWSFYGDPNHKKTINLPESFYDNETNNLFVKFHIISNVKSFQLPSGFGSGIARKRTPTTIKISLSNMNNLPLYIDGKVRLDFFPMTPVEKAFYEEIVVTDSFLIGQKEHNFTIDDCFIYFLASSDLHDHLKNVNVKRIDLEKFKNEDQKIYNALLSIVGVNKFNL